MPTKLTLLLAPISLFSTFALAGTEVSYVLDAKSLTTNSNSDTQLDAPIQVQYADREWSEPGVEQGVGDGHRICDGCMCCGRQLTRYSRRIERRFEWVSEQMWPRTREMLCSGEIEVTYETRDTVGL
jgi:hypothetical protein